MTLLIFLAVIGVIIFVHELGHFAIAKIAGVYVDTFSLGFGPRIIGIRIGETDYRISLIPLGGYVRMFGQFDLPEDEDKADMERYKDIPAYRRYDHQPILARMAIIVAGPLMNILFAFPVAMAMLMSGVQQPIDVDETTIGDVVQDSPAYVSGLIPGDTIIEIDGERVHSWHGLVGEMTTRIGDITPLTYIRNGETNYASVVPEINSDAGYMGIGIQQMQRAQIASITSNSPACNSGLQENDVVDRLIGLYLSELSLEKLIDAIQARPHARLVLGVKRFPTTRMSNETNDFTRDRIVLDTERAGKIKHVTVYGNMLLLDKTAPTNSPLKSGDTLLRINNQAVTDKTANDIISALPAGPVSLQIERISGKIKKEKIQTNVTATIHDIGRIGVIFTPAHQIVRYTFMDALKEAPKKVWARFFETLQVIRMLFQRKIGLNQLTGPVGIARLTGMAAQSGIDVLLSLVLLITVNLGILNLLPLPVLDGGHVVLLTIEWIWTFLFKKKLAPAFLLIYQWTGFIIIIALTIYVFYNDILNWIISTTSIGLYIGRAWEYILSLLPF